MIELAIFRKKGDFIKTNGDQVVDLTRRSVSFRGVTVNQGKTYVVEEGLQMRGDLISKVFYQTSSFLCLLLKYNGISNPFAINVNDILKMPDGSVLSAMLATPDKLNGSDNNWTTSTRKKKKPQFIKPATKQDQKRLDYLTTKYGTAVAPTTAAKDTSVKITNGKVVFGSGVTSIKKEDCPDPISRTKLLATLLKNKING
jgi:hypothetical protein